MHLKIPYGSGTFPALRVDPQNRSRASCDIDEAAVVADLAVAKHPCQQGQGVLGKGRVGEGYLPVLGL